MTSTSTHGSFWTLGISGLIGATIGAGGMYFSQKQANTAENQYFMELDRLRHSAFLNENVPFEAKLQDLNLLQEVRRNGFRHVFEQNLKRDIAEIELSIETIEQARLESEEAAREARRVEEARAEAAAQERKEQAVRTNPLIFESCGYGTTRICP
jgi:hypothetical protein